MQNQRIIFTHNDQQYTIDANRDRGSVIREETRNGKTGRTFVHDNFVAFKAYRAEFVKAYGFEPYYTDEMFAREQAQRERRIK